MTAEVFQETDIVEGCSLFLGQSIDLRQLRHIERISLSPFTIRTGANGMAVLFRYGVVVLFGLQPQEVKKFLANLQGLIKEPFGEPEKEVCAIYVDPAIPEGLVQERICLHGFTVESLQIVADVMAKSTVLSHYELNLTKHFDRIEPFAERLRHGRFGGLKGRDLLQHIGDTLMIEAKMTGRIEVTEKPELTWDYPQYERLYMRLEDEFDLSERHAAIDRKLGLISRTAQTLLDLIHNERSLRVEWYIVILIIAEIVIAIFEKVS